MSISSIANSKCFDLLRATPKQRAAMLGLPTGKNKGTPWNVSGPVEGKELLYLTALMRMLRNLCQKAVRTSVYAPVGKWVNMYAYTNPALNGYTGNEANSYGWAIYRNGVLWRSGDNMEPAPIEPHERNGYKGTASQWVSEVLDSLETGDNLFGNGGTPYRVVLFNAAPYAADQELGIRDSPYNQRHVVSQVISDMKRIARRFGGDGRLSFALSNGKYKRLQKR